MRRLALIDRDGTIIDEKHFLADPNGVRLIPGAADAIIRLNRADWAVAIVTNQSGVGRGYYTLGQMHAVNGRTMELLTQAGARIDALEWCPHHPLAGLTHLRRICDCRKPRPGQAFAAAYHLGLSVTGCVAVGDRISDVKLGQRLGGKGVMVMTGYGKSHRYKLIRERVHPDALVPDLTAAVEWMLKP